jgi:cytochrome c oxidase assembly protein Cox11
MFKLTSIIVISVFFACCSNKKLLKKKNKIISICKLESKQKDKIINKLYKEIKISEETNNKAKLSFDFTKSSQKEKMKICRNKVLHYKILLEELKERNRLLEKSLYKEEEIEAGGC